jgi:hypothetical protein
MYLLLLRTLLPTPCSVVYFKKPTDKVSLDKSNADAEPFGKFPSRSSLNEDVTRFGPTPAGRADWYLSLCCGYIHPYGSPDFLLQCSSLTAYKYYVSGHGTNGITEVEFLSRHCTVLLKSHNWRNSVWTVLSITPFQRTKLQKQWSSGLWKEYCTYILFWQACSLLPHKVLILMKRYEFYGFIMKCYEYVMKYPSSFNGTF